MNKTKAKDKEHLRELIEDAFAKEIYDLNFIDTSQVTDMSELFQNIAHDFDVSQWNVSNVIYMMKMFARCESFDQDLSEWDVSNVSDMSWMFSGCASFDQDMSEWDVSQVTDMSWMFSRCTSFDQDLSKWDVCQALDLRFMFSGCLAFNQNLSTWDVTTNYTDMFGMLEGVTGFDFSHIPKGFYTEKGVVSNNIPLDQAIKDLINTYDLNNIELALILAGNVGQLEEAKQYIDKSIVVDELFRKLEKEASNLRAKVKKLIEAL